MMSPRQVRSVTYVTSLAGAAVKAKLFIVFATVLFMVSILLEILKVFVCFSRCIIAV